MTIIIHTNRILLLQSLMWFHQYLDRKVKKLQNLVTHSNGINHQIDLFMNYFDGEEGQ